MDEASNLRGKKRFALVIVAPPDYPHWQAFKEISDCLHSALLRLGHDCVQTFNRCSSDRINIVLGGNLLPIGQQLSAPSIIFNLEQIYVGSPWLSDNYLSVLRRHPVWDYSEKNIAALRQLGVENVAHVPIGYVPELSRIVPAEKSIDVLFYGSIGDRRGRILRRLRSLGVNVRAEFGLYGEQRDRLIAQSKIVLNMHHYDSRLFEIVRVSYLLANKVFVVSEESTDQDAEREFMEGMVVVPYRQLVKTCLRYLVDDSGRQSIATRGFELFSTRDQSMLLTPVVERLP